MSESANKGGEEEGGKSGQVGLGGGGRGGVGRECTIVLRRARVIMITLLCEYKHGRVRERTWLGGVRG